MTNHHKLTLGQTVTTLSNGEEIVLQLKGDYMLMAMGADATTTPNFINEVNGTGKSAHPLTQPIDILYAGATPPDVLDYYKKVSSSKKSLYKNPLKFSEVLDIIQASVVMKGEVEDWKIDNGLWKSMLGNPEGSAFTIEEISAIAYDTREHYAILSVPSGFYYYAALINLEDVMLSTGLMVKIPVECQRDWWVAAITAIWVVYEGVGLGGLNTDAMALHKYLGSVARSGSIHLKQHEPGYEELKMLGTEQFLTNHWRKVLRSQDIDEAICTNDSLLQLVVWLAHLRELGKRVASGRELNDYLSKYSFGDLTTSECVLLACISTIMRDGAKGRMNLEVQEETDEAAGCLKYILEEYPDFTDSIKIGKDSLMGLIMLKDMLKYQTAFTKFRLGEIAKDTY